MQKVKKRLVKMFLFIVMFFTGIFPIFGYSTTVYATTTEKTKKTKETNYDLNVTISDKGEGSAGIIDGGETSTIETGNTLIDKLKLIFVIVIGSATVILAIIFVFNCVQLAANANKPNAKQVSYSAILTVLIATVLCGATTIILGLSFNLFSS